MTLERRVAIIAFVTMFGMGVAFLYFRAHIPPCLTNTPPMECDLPLLKSILTGFGILLAGLAWGLYGMAHDTGEE